MTMAQALQGAVAILTVWGHLCLAETETAGAMTSPVPADETASPGMGPSLAGSLLYTVRVTFDPDGGVVSPSYLLFQSNSTFKGMPIPTRSGYAFKGWWTRKNGGGREVKEEYEVNNVVHYDPNATLALYAKWAKNYRLTVQGGVIEGEGSGFEWVPESDKRKIVAPEVDGKYFEKWLVIPSSADLGTLFDPQVTQGFIPCINPLPMTMPAMDVSLSAVYVSAAKKGRFSVEVTGNTPGLGYSDILWSIDRTTWTQANFNQVPSPGGLEYPHKTGSYKITYRSVNLHWLAPADQWVKITADALTEARAVATYVPLVSWGLCSYSWDANGTVLMWPSSGQVLPGLGVVLTAKPAKGSVFVGWANLDGLPAGSERSPTLTVAPATDATYVACFRSKADMAPPQIQCDALAQGMVGVAYRTTVSINEEAWPATFSASSLPPGLKLDPVTGAISGVPAQAGTFNVTVKASNVKGASEPRKVVLKVDPLPAWASGAFNGKVEEFFAYRCGSASMSVTAHGGATGKFNLRGTNFSFSAKNYASRGEDGALSLVATAKVGRVSWPLVLTVRPAQGADPAGVLPPALSKAESGLDGSSCLVLYRDVWSETSGTVFQVNDYIGYYTATLPLGYIAGSGYLAFTVDKKGCVKTAGRLADGQAISLSGTLVLDESGHVWTVLYTAPAAYRGGCLCGIAEFAKSSGGPIIVRRQDWTLFAWINLDPHALYVIEYGFMGEMNVGLELCGGMYNSQSNLYNYYAGGLVVDGADQMPWLTTAKKTIGWSPNGAGKISSLTKVPVKASSSPNGLELGVEPETGEITSKAAELTFTFNRTTGLFKGTCRTRYEYMSAWDETTLSATYEYADKDVPFEGALTPVRESGEAEGRGFMLWSCDPKDFGFETDDHAIPMSCDFKLMRR